LKDQREESEKIAILSSEIEARPYLNTPEKDPSTLENYDALCQSAQSIATVGTISLRHYLISENVGNSYIEEMIEKGRRLDAKDFKNTEAFETTCLFYVLLSDSFGDDSSSFVQKTSALSDDERSAFIETRLQALQFLAEKAQNTDPDASYAACALYAIEVTLLKNREIFHCYDLLCRKAINAAYPISYAFAVTDELEAQRWEITKRCYDSYTNGDLTAKETLNLMDTERQGLNDPVSIYRFLEYEPYV
jgi:hypothetical protein